MPSESIFTALTDRFEDMAGRELAPVEVAVVDSGVDSSHPDLAGRVVAAFRVEEVSGEFEVVPGEVGRNADVFGHGTAVASIVARLSPNARIVDVRVLDEENLGSGRALLAGFEHVLDRGSPIVNMSLAATADYASRLAALCEKAYRANQLVVAARRNMPLLDEGYPAEFSSAISVDCERRETPYSIAYRPGVPIEYVAHGEDVTAAAPGGGYASRTGTSFATPVISALCALILGAYPDLEPFEVKTVLKALSD